MNLPEVGVLTPALESLFAATDQVLHNERPELLVENIGTIRSVGNGVVRVIGLPEIKVDELLLLSNEKGAAADVQGIAFNLDREEIGVVLLGSDEHLSAGQPVRRTNRVVDTPVGEGLLGRVVDPLGRPLDGKGALRSTERWPIERDAAPIVDRAPVTVPIQTGIKVIDALIPVGRGQRELIVGDRQTGKTTIAIDTIINQRHEDVICIFCAIGQPNSAVARIIDDLRKRDAFGYTIMVVAMGEEAAGLQFIAPYAATSMAEYFMEQGRDVLVIYDDLTAHARAYRELSLLLRRPPGREAYPGDIFYIHSRLLERATQLNEARGGGSLTALPIIETQAQNLSAYIPTNLISITDGQIYLSPDLFQKGILPAVDVGRSVSRVGGKTQLPAYRSVAGALRLSYAQFEELEAFSRFDTRLDDETRRRLERGRRVRAVLQQPAYAPIPVPEQIAVLLAAGQGLFDRLPVQRIPAVEQAVRNAIVNELPELCRRITRGDPLSDEDRTLLIRHARRAISAAHDDELPQRAAHGNA
ncbi:alternate F1F0 ATPase, F1 subunit alpha [bacterium]|nr:alternate F1F0 ATPase, F1 subunit alpha [bacterium]